MAKRDFLSMTDGALQVWAVNYKDQIMAQGASLGLSSEDMEIQISACEAIIKTIQDVAACKDALTHASQTKNETLNTRGRQLRTTIARLKTHPVYTEGHG